MTINIILFNFEQELPHSNVVRSWHRERKKNSWMQRTLIFNNSNSLCYKRIVVCHFLLRSSFLPLIVCMCVYFPALPTLPRLFFCHIFTDAPANDKFLWIRYNVHWPCCSSVYNAQYMQKKLLYADRFCSTWNRIQDYEPRRMGESGRNEGKKKLQIVVRIGKRRFHSLVKTCFRTKTSSHINDYIHVGIYTHTHMYVIWVLLMPHVYLYNCFYCYKTFINMFCYVYKQLFPVRKLTWTISQRHFLLYIEWWW